MWNRGQKMFITRLLVLSALREHRATKNASAVWTLLLGYRTLTNPIWTGEVTVLFIHLHRIIQLKIGYSSNCNEVMIIWLAQLTTHYFTTCINSIAALSTNDLRKLTALKEYKWPNPPLFGSGTCVLLSLTDSCPVMEQWHKILKVSELPC